jgi:hypothetical protein
LFSYNLSFQEERREEKLADFVNNVLVGHVIHAYSCILTDIIFSAAACTFSSYTNMRTPYPEKLFHKFSGKRRQRSMTETSFLHSLLLFFLVKLKHISF